MKRWTFRISPWRAASGGVLCLILGVVTTVGVAWGAKTVLALTEPEYFEGGEVMRCVAWDVELYVDRLWRAMADSTSNNSRHGVSMDVRGQIRWDGFDTFAGRKETYGVCRAGWPFRAMRADFLMGGGYRYALDTHGASFFGANPGMLPLRPILPGFVIDTLFYAVIWFGLFFGLSGARRSIRRRRGRCVKCGYDLRGQRSAVSDQKSVVTQGCPECGWGREGADL